MNDLLAKALSGDEIAISKVLTKIESFTTDGMHYLSELMKKGGRAHTIGITGLPGSGKSTLIREMIKMYLKQGLKVATILVEPSSPFSMGSFMGNRIRMQELSTEGNVFIRSLSSDGNLGGLSVTALMFIEVFDGLGYNKIIVETVGAGQNDVDLKDVVHTKIVINVPGTGDEIQMLKAGLMEIGDLYVINKAEKPEALMLEDALRFLVESEENLSDWRPKIIKTIALRGIGVNELISAIEEHKNYLINKNIFNTVTRKRRIKLAELYLRWHLENIVKKILVDDEDAIEKFITNDMDFNTLIQFLLKEIKIMF